MVQRDAVPVRAAWKTPRGCARRCARYLVGSEIQPTLTLRVYNYAHLDPGLLTSAEKLATSILKRAGAEAVWVECPLSSAAYERYPGCEEGMQTTDFVIRLLSASMSSKAPVSN